MSGNSPLRASPARLRGALLLTAALTLAISLLATSQPAASQPQAPTTPTTRFTSFDIFIDPASAPLGAYQVDLRAVEGTIKLVGVEGGEHAAYAAPPYYDPAALHADAGEGGDGHIILAAFSTAPADQLPAARTRVARLHVQITGDAAPRFEARLTAAATANGEEITAKATVTVSEGDAK